MFVDFEGVDGSAVGEGLRCERQRAGVIGRPLSSIPSSPPVRQAWRVFVMWSSYLMVLPVRRRIHWGMGRFCFCALASFCFVRKVLWLCFAVVVSPGPHCEISPAVTTDCIVPGLPSPRRTRFRVGNPYLNWEVHLQAVHTGILTVLSRYPRWYAVSSGLVEMGWESNYLVWAFENGPGRARKCVVAEIT